MWNINLIFIQYVIPVMLSSLPHISIFLTPRVVISFQTLLPFPSFQSLVDHISPGPNVYICVPYTCTSILIDGIILFFRMDTETSELPLVLHDCPTDVQHHACQLVDEVLNKKHHKVILDTLITLYRIFSNKVIKSTSCQSKPSGGAFML